MKKKRILVYGMNYAPEIAGVGRYTGEIAEYLAATGAEVEVVTTPAHYPGWEVQPPFRNAYRTEMREGVRVLRCPLLLRRRMEGVWRLIAPISFAATSAPAVIWRILRRRPDVVLCIEPTLIAAPAAVLAAKLVGSRLALQVQDLEVDAAFAVGHLGDRKWLRNLGLAFERFISRRFDTIVTISNRMADKIAEKGVAPGKIAVVRNWVDLQQIFPLAEADGGYRRELGLSDDDFVVLYSGNIGAKQGLGVLLEAARQLQEYKRIRFVIAGEGPVKANLIAEFGSLPNVQFLPFQPYSRLNHFLNTADLHALPQDEGAADLVLPSKLGGMLASGRPIVVTASPGTELAEFLDGAATISPPGDSAALARAILAASQDRAAAESSALLRGRLAQQLSKQEGLVVFAAVIGAGNDPRRGNPRRETEPQIVSSR